MTRRALGVIAAGSTTLAGCAGEPDTGPPAIHYGQDVCALCTMIVSEEPSSAALVVSTDARLEPLVFDDLGCFFAWQMDHAEGRVVTRWVHDRPSGDWVQAETAWYVRSPQIRTPMGSGVAAFTDRDAAAGVARDRDGELLDWIGLSDFARTRGLLAPPPAATGG